MAVSVYRRVWPKASEGPSTRAESFPSKGLASSTRPTNCKEEKQHCSYHYGCMMEHVQHWTRCIIRSYCMDTIILYMYCSCS